MIAAWTLVPAAQAARRGRAYVGGDAAHEREAFDRIVIVICAGGGGVPMVREASGALRGAEAVIDKDLCAALLASQLEASVLLMLTDADAVYEGWGGPDAIPIRRATPSMLRRMTFLPGSMAPKVEAACRFAQAGGAGARFGDRCPGGRGGHPPGREGDEGRGELTRTCARAGVPRMARPQESTDAGARTAILAGRQAAVRRPARRFPPIPSDQRLARRSHSPEREAFP